MAGRYQVRRNAGCIFGQGDKFRIGEDHEGRPVDGHGLVKPPAKQELQRFPFVRVQLATPWDSVAAPDIKSLFLPHNFRNIGKGLFRLRQEAFFLKLLIKPTV